MKRLLPFLLLPLLIQAGPHSYGEDPFTLGLSLDAFSLGHLRGLPLATTSLGGNGAGASSTAPILGLLHTEGFGGIYQTDVIQYRQADWSLILFRGGVSGIADTRGALLDVGTDGQADTQDADGTEGNGRLDPGERLSINRINFFSTTQWVLETGVNHPLGARLDAYLAVRFLYHDLTSEQGWGLGFHGGLSYRILPTWRLGVQITDLLTTTVFWTSGSRESYVPHVYLATDYVWKLREIPFQFRPVVQMQMAAGERFGEEGNRLAWSGGLEMGFKDQLVFLGGWDPEKYPTLGVRIQTRFLDLQYATSLGGLHEASGATHRVGARFHLSEISFLN